MRNPAGGFFNPEKEVEAESERLIDHLGSVGRLVGWGLFFLCGSPRETTRRSSTVLFSIMEHWPAKRSLPYTSSLIDLPLNLIALGLFPLS